MATFAMDGDLLAYEPGVFEEVPLVGQVRLEVSDASVSGSTVTSVTGGFGVLEPGCVLTLRGAESLAASYAVLSVTDGNTVELVEAAVRFEGMGSLRATSVSFGVQLGGVHEELMRAVGIEPDDPSELLDEGAIVSVGQMKRLEVLAALGRVYRSAAVLGSEGAVVERKAALYEGRLARALGGARVLVDLDGDGIADAWRAPAAGRLVRV